MSECKHETLARGYYGHVCAACGELVYPHGSEPWNDGPDDEDYDWDDDWREWETACVVCGDPGIDCCQCCGGYLCGMHSEIGVGFCRECPTQAWIEEQAALL